MNSKAAWLAFGGLSFFLPKRPFAGSDDRRLGTAGVSTIFGGSLGWTGRALASRAFSARPFRTARNSASFSARTTYAFRRSANAFKSEKGVRRMSEMTRAVTVMMKAR